jgi:hypothetical protein
MLTKAYVLFVYYLSREGGGKMLYVPQEFPQGKLTPSATPRATTVPLWEANLHFTPLIHKNFFTLKVISLKLFIDIFNVIKKIL